MHIPIIVRHYFICLCLIFIGTSQIEAHQLISDLSYESPGGMSNQLDLYTPDGGVNSDLPTLLYIHGGGWYSGDKLWSSPLFITLANQGYSVVSCNYTLSTQTKPSFPQAVHDVKAVIRWIRTVGTEQYHLPSTIVSFGASAGGHLSMMLQSTSGVEYFEPLPPPEGGYAVQAAFSFFGPTDLVKAARNGFGKDRRLVNFLGKAFNEETEELWTMASPISHLDPSDPPLTIFHGTHDNVVSFKQSTAMYTATQKSGLLSWFFPFNGGHEIVSDLGGPRGVAMRMQQLLPAMLAQDISSNVTITGVDISVGQKVSGNPTRLYYSDDRYLRCKQNSGATTKDQVVSLVTHHEVGDQNAQFVDLSVESKTSTASGTMTVYLYDFVQKTSVEMGRFPIDGNDGTHTLKDVALNQYRNEFGDIDMRIDFANTSPAHANDFDVWIDQVHLHAH